MKAQDLLTLATAHSVDIAQAARQQTHVSRERALMQSRMRKILISNPKAQIRPEQTARCAQTHVTDHPSWTNAEAGHAAAGVSRIPWYAASFTYMDDNSAFWVLWEALMFEALRMRVRHHWSPQVKGADGHMRFYLENLTNIVLEEQRHRPIFTAAPALYAVLCGVTEDVWERTLFVRFDMIRNQYDRWLHTAIGIMNARLEEDEEVCI